MTHPRTDLLSALSPISRASGGAEVGPRGASALGAASFASLLGGLTGLGGGGAITIGQGVDVSLSDAQVARLGEATDRAARAGAREALVVLDGLTLRVDVSKREVTESVSMAHGDVITGIDAIVQASEPGTVGVLASAQGSSAGDGDVLQALLRSSTPGHPGLLKALSGAASGD